MWFIGVEVEQETSAPPPKKNPGSAPALSFVNMISGMGKIRYPVFTEKSLVQTVQPSRSSRDSPNFA